MRAIIVIIFLVLILAAVGWLRFSSPNGNPSVEIDAAKVRQDTSEVIESSKRAVGAAADDIDSRLNEDTDRGE